jgi:cytidine deaminase
MAVVTAAERGSRMIRTEKAGFSCGVCTQVLREMSELSGNDIRMIYSNTRGDRVIIINASELYRHMFGPKALGVDVKKYQDRINRLHPGVF